MPDLIDLFADSDETFADTFETLQDGGLSLRDFDADALAPYRMGEGE